MGYWCLFYLDWSGSPMHKNDKDSVAVTDLKSWKSRSSHANDDYPIHEILESCLNIT